MDENTNHNVNKQSTGVAGHMNVLLGADYREYLRGKTVTLMGLGLLGRGIGDARFFAQYAKHVIVTDKKSEQELQSSVDALKQYTNITFVLGEHRLEDFGGDHVDIVCKGAGVPLDSEHIAYAREKNKMIVMSTALFAYYTALLGVKIVGVTGTRGKTMTAHLIAHILKTAGNRVLLGGNIKGMSTIEALPHIGEYDYCVLELDSWQLQGFGDLSISPHISVFTTFMNDHMNYYAHDTKRYLEDKLNIIRNQHAGDYCYFGEHAAQAIGMDAHEVVQQAKQRGVGITIVRDSLPNNWHFNMLGAHNRNSAAIATQIALSSGVDSAHIEYALSNFKGVPGRLELLKLGGSAYSSSRVDWINDTTATTPEALSAGIQAMIDAQKTPFVLIAGGTSKQLHTKLASQAIVHAGSAIAGVVLLPGSGTDEMLQDGTLGNVSIVRVENMTQAVTQAAQIAEQKRVKHVLFSPGFASFGLFKNEYDRGDMFVREVEDYTGSVVEHIHGA